MTLGRRVLLRGPFNTPTCLPSKGGDASPTHASQRLLSSCACPLCAAVHGPKHLNSHFLPKNPERHAWPEIEAKICPQTTSSAGVFGTKMVFGTNLQTNFPEDILVPEVDNPDDISPGAPATKTVLLDCKGAAPQVQQCSCPVPTHFSAES